MNSKVVCYTALVGAYDELRSPSYVSPNWNYICFTDQPFGDQVGVWEIRPLVKVIEGDPTRTNRWHKMHPHILFPDYDVSVYVDSNIEIIGPHLETKLRDLLLGVNMIALPAHPLRDCVYDEIVECIACRLDRLSFMQANAQVLRKSGYPEKNGLYENNLIIRKHNDPVLIALMLEWWDMLSRYSKRDQLSLVYLLWKHKIQVEEIVPPGTTIRNHSDYKYTLHPHLSQRVKPRGSHVFARLITSFIPVPKWRRYLRNRLKGKRAPVEHLIRVKWSIDKQSLPLMRAHRLQYDIMHRFHHEVLGEFPELINPRTYNDKIAWLMLFDQQQLAIQCTDKFGARQFVEDRIGCAYLNELYATGDAFDGIAFDDLPDSFVVKTNHDSGTVVLVKDSANWDRKSSRLQIQAALKKPYGIEKGEWAYQFIPKKVIVEKYLGLNDRKPLVDYKFHCVDGKVRWLQYIFDRGESTKEMIFDRDFQRLPLHLDEQFIKYEGDLPKPNKWDELVTVAEKLAFGFKYVRVDLYYLQDRIFFGELTFFPMSGCYASLDLCSFGDMMDFDLETYKMPVFVKHIDT